MSGFFKPSVQQTSSTTDPYGGLPEWARNYYKNDSSRTGDLISDAESLSQQRGGDPSTVAGMSDNETRAMRDMQRRNTQTQGLLGDGRAAIAGGASGTQAAQNRADGSMDWGMGEALDFDNRAMGVVDQATDEARQYDDTAVNSMTRGNDTARGYLDRADGALGGERYMSGYTDDVVNTTLAGMDRNAARQQMERGASEASIGGLGGTRGGVADALAGQLNGMDRAQMEASLRDKGFTFGSEMGLRESQQLQSIGMDHSGMGFGEADVYRGIGQDRLASGFQEADFLRDIGGDRYGMGMDRAGVFEGRGDKAFDRGMATGGYMIDSANAGMGLQGSASQYDATYGEAERGVQQNRNDLKRDEMDWYAQIFNGSRGLPSTGAGSTSSTQPGPSMASSLLGAASTAAGIWSAIPSDERVKDDIREEGGALDKLEKTGAYSYTYKPGIGHTRDRTSGLMAQDLERSGITGAVIEKDGVKHVDPYPVLATVVQAINELKREVRQPRQMGLS